jgi:hypothetical protein
MLLRILLILLMVSCASQSERFTSPAYRSTPDLFSHLSGEETEPESETAKLTFTGTTTWTKVFDGVRLKRPKPGYIPENALELMNLPNPPANTSERTRAELVYLEGLKKYRTPGIREQILRERERGELRFGHLWGYELALWTHDDPVSVYLTDGLRDIYFQMIYAKEKFNRVRPHKLRPSLDPVIITPHHPSYPSGHCAEYYGVALLLARLDPKNAEVYKQDGLRIGINREIAGVHYPSDTALGIEIATKVVDMLFQNPAYVKLFEEARSYWAKTNGKRKWP